MIDMLDRIYRSLYRIRRVEEEIARVYPSDKIKSPVHLSIGQEAVAVGVCEALEASDITFGTYRSHALYLAKGGDLKGMIAELYGKQTGCCKGKGGSMHLADARHGVMGTSAVVATTIPNAAGYAYASKLRNDKRVIVSFFGDGATEEGVFWETLNFAVLKKLPILFVCENNKYAIHAPFETRHPADNIVERVRAFGVSSTRIADNDVLAIYDSVHSAAKSMRAGNAGPIFIECMTYRWREHVGPNEDFNLGYRSAQEAEKWIHNDAMRTIGAKLDDGKRKKIETEVEAEIREAFKFAEESPWPDAKELWTYVYKE
jgi:TPP-dependent pyruvate/acetoin dehydrogenase alpha subunit